MPTVVPLNEFRSPVFRGRRRALCVMYACGAFSPVDRIRRRAPVVFFGSTNISSRRVSELPRRVTIVDLAPSYAVFGSRSTRTSVRQRSLRRKRGRTSTTSHWETAIVYVEVKSTFLVPVGPITERRAVIAVDRRRWSRNDANRSSASGVRNTRPRARQSGNESEKFPRPVVAL